MGHALMITADLITHADGTRFLRTGECDGCARPGLTRAMCCTYMSLPIARALSEDETHWVHLHPGVRIEDGSVIIPIPCSALTDEGRCSLFGKPERPEMCVRAPELPGQVIAGCNYQLVPLGTESGVSQ